MSPSISKEECVTRQEMFDGTLTRQDEKSARRLARYDAKLKHWLALWYVGT